jgi:hypothetical protein
MMIKGYQLAICELGLWFICAHALRNHVESLQQMGLIMYYWFCFTVITGMWEYYYVTQYHSIASFARMLVTTDNSIWLMDIPIHYLSINLFAELFYAEYGANADREYISMKKGDYWSRLIESSHAFCCASFCLASLVSTVLDNEKFYLIGMVGMGMQFMNSLLYMGQYFLQCKDSHSPNYKTNLFPTGPFLCDRLFMWVNLFWLLFPTIIIFQYI